MRSGELPFTHPWEQGPIARYADVIVGGTPSTEIPRFWGGEIKWMASGDIHLRNVFDVPGRISEHGLAASNAVIVPPRAIAMALAGQGKTRGTVALTHISLCTNQSVALIKPRDERLDPDFLFQALIPRYEEMRSRSAGGGRAGLTKGIIEQTPIQVPAPIEQQRIAEILTTIDKAIEQTEALIAKTQQIKAGLMHDLFTRGVTPDGQLRPPRSEAPQLYKESPLGWIPKEWDADFLCNLAEIRTGIAKNAGRVFANPVTVQYLRVANVQDGFLDLSEMKTIQIESSDLDRYRVLPNDVLMNEGGDLDKLGRGAIWTNNEPCVHQNHVFVVRCGARILPAFLNAWTASPVARRHFMVAGKQTTNLASINKTSLGRLSVLVPPAPEQSLIAQTIEALEKRLASDAERLTKWRFTKQGLMHDLLTGVVRVPRTPALELAAEPSVV